MSYWRITSFPASGKQLAYLESLAKEARANGVDPRTESIFTTTDASDAIARLKCLKADGWKESTVQSLTLPGQ